MPLKASTWELVSPQCLQSHSQWGIQGNKEKGPTFLWQPAKQCPCGGSGTSSFHTDAQCNETSQKGPVQKVLIGASRD